MYSKGSAGSDEVSSWCRHACAASPSCLRAELGLANPSKSKTQTFGCLKVEYEGENKKRLLSTKPHYNTSVLSQDAMKDDNFIENK
jgi:hypothetical protein